MNLTLSLRFAALLASLCLIAAPCLASPGDSVYTHPGTLVSVGGRSINFNCEGSGGPTVVFDAGFEDWSPAWAIVQPRIAKTTRACSYDRPGSGFSDPGLMPRTSVRIAEDLHAALHAGHIPGPYVLVGHSFGSYNIRTFLDLYPREVAAMVIVDGENGDVESPKEQRQDDAFDRQVLPVFEKCLAAIAAARPLPRVRFPGSKRAFVCNRVFFRRMPDPAFSPALNRYIERTSKTQIPLWNQIISEMREMPADERYLQTHVHRMGNKPLYVLTALNHYGDTSRLTAKQRAQIEAFERANARSQARWLTLSANSKQWFAPKSGHYIELEDPMLVVRAVEGAVAQVRGGT